MEGEEDFAASRTYPDIPPGVQMLRGLSHNMNSKPIPRVRAGKQTCKIVQCEGALTMSFKRRVPSPSEPDYMIVDIPLCCPLQLVDRTTAEVMVACQAESLAIPLWDIIRSSFEHYFEMSTADMAASNLKAERFPPRPKPRP